MSVEPGPKDIVKMEQHISYSAWVYTRQHLNSGHQHLIFSWCQPRFPSQHANSVTNKDDNTFEISTTIDHLIHWTAYCTHLNNCRKEPEKKCIE